MALGIFASISLIMVGLFPETHIKQHVLAASGVFGTLFIIIILVSVALFNHPKFMKIVAYWGVFAIIIDLIFKYLLSEYKEILAVFNPSMPIPSMEWVAVFSSLIWVGLLAYNMLKRL